MPPLRQTVAAKSSGVAVVSRFAKRASYNNIRAFQLPSGVCAPATPGGGTANYRKDYNELTFTRSLTALSRHNT